MQLLSFNDYAQQARQLAEQLGLPITLIEVHDFPDGEKRVKLPENIDEHIVIIRGLDHPNDKLIELLLSCHTAREMGAKRISLIAPYLCYMRQDIAFHPGESISQKAIGQLIANMVDDLITVDPHLHRTPTLIEAMPVANAVTLSATDTISHFIQSQQITPILLGPDGESEQWVTSIAAETKLEYVVATKERLGDRRVVISLPEYNYQNREILLIDDMASTGQTLINITQQLQAAGAGTINVIVTHPLFIDDAYQALHLAGIQNIWSCDTVTHESNRISLAEMLAEAVREHLL